MITISAFSRHKLFKIKGILPVFFMLASFLLLTPEVEASPFSFSKSPYPVVGGGQYTIVSNILKEGNANITGTHRVDVAFDFPTDGEVNSITLYGDSTIVLDDTHRTATLFAGYNFSAVTSTSRLTVPIMTDATAFGTATLTFTVNAGTNTVGTANIDTRLQGSENIATGHRYGEDPLGLLIDFAPSTGGVTVTENRVTGLMWSEGYGWIDLQPAGQHVALTIVSNQLAQLSGLAYNETLGYIDFGPVDTPQGQSSGVYIDGDGVFHGTAWSQGGFGFLAFGDFMPLNDGFTQYQKDQTKADHAGSSWAKTSWVFNGNKAPTITLTSPPTGPSEPDRTPEFAFHIADAEQNEIGYLISIEHEVQPTIWAAYRSYETPEATLASSVLGVDLTYSFVGQDFDAGSYRWRMKAYDKFSAWSEYTAYNAFTIDNGKPGFDLIAPDQNSINLTRTPEFKFNINEPDGDLIRYQVQVFNNEDLALVHMVAASPLSGYLFADTEANLGTTFTYTPPVSLPAGTLFWRLYVFDEYDQPALLWDTTYRQFEIGNTNPTITEISLRDNNNNEIIPGGDTFDTSPTIVWTSNDGDTGPTGTLTTTITIYTDAGLTTVLDDFPQTVTHPEGRKEYALPVLGTGDYWLRVTTCDEDNECAADEDWAFSIVNRTRFGNIGTLSINSFNPRRTILPGDADADDNQYAWNAMKGWIDLNPEGGGVIVEESRVVGYAWSEYLGWIRMNCQAADADSGILMSDECDTNDYGVINKSNLTSSTLSGKALVERTGHYIYFDEDSYNADFPDEPIPGGGQTPDVHISCDPTIQNPGADQYVTKGFFSGWAWSADSGWISLGADEINEHGGDGIDLAGAQKKFAITEWSCGEGLDPEFIETSKYKVTGAKSSDIRYPIAQKSNSPYAGNLICTQGAEALDQNNPSTYLKVYRVPADGSAGVELQYGDDFNFDCSEPNDPGKLYLTIKSTSTLSATKTPGLLRISGRVADINKRSTTEIVTSLDDPNLFNEDYILQIVSAKPDETKTKTALDLAKGGVAEANRLANFTDKMIYQVKLYDAFNNPVYTVHQYENPNNSVIIKNVTYKAIFHDEVKLDQVDNVPTIKQATDFVGNGTLISKDIDKYDNGATSPAYIYDFNPTNSSSTLTVDIVSRAPTIDEDNILSLHRIEATVERKFDVTNTNLDVGQIDTPDNTQNFVLNEPIKFYPIVTADFNGGDFNGFGNVLDTPDSLQIRLTNHDLIKPVDPYDWMILLRTQDDGGNWGDTVYRYLTLNPPAGNDPTPYYKELAGFLQLPDSNEFPVWGKSYFHNTLEPYVKKYFATFSYIIQGGTPLPIIPANGSQLFTLTATPVLEGEIDMSDAEYPQLVQAIAVPMGNRIAKYKLLSPTSLSSFNIVTVAVSGSIHGEAVNTSVIVGKDATSAEYAKVGKIYTRPDIRKLMYEAYHTLTGNSQPAAINSEVNSHPDIQQYEINDAGDFATARNPAPTGFGIQDGKVIWLDRDTDKTGLIVDLGDQSDLTSNELNIPATQGPVTLLVRGGNLYIRDNIITGPGTTLGIIMLRAEGEQSNSHEGNIFIDPSVTRIEAALYADGSVMSALDGMGADENGLIEESEIFDGFTDGGNAKKLSNQLLIQGSIVSQNMVGTASDATIPSNDVWLAIDCDQDEDGVNECTDDAIKMTKLAKRYDFNYLRRYRLVTNELNDPHQRSINPLADCKYPEHLLASPTPVPCLNGYTASSANSTPTPIQYNPDCQTSTGELLTTGFAAYCRPLPASLKSDANGVCAANTPWCNDTTKSLVDGTFLMNCGGTSGGTTNSGFCDTTVGIKNRKIGAALIIEYDPQLKQLTPIGMNTPAFIEVGE